MKSREEVENLKKNWLEDPCYDIETTEGFEEYKEELLEFSVQKKKENEEAYEKRKREQIERIYSQEIGEQNRIGNSLYTRVPGGWIVSIEHDNGNESSSYTSVFVRFDFEFKPGVDLSSNK